MGIITPGSFSFLFKFESSFARITMKGASPPNHYSDTTLTDLGETHEEILGMILSYIPKEYLPCTICVCKQWHEVLSDKIHNNLNVFRELVILKDVGVIAWITSCDLTEAKLFVGANDVRFVDSKKREYARIVEDTLNSPKVLKGCVTIIKWLSAFDVDWSNILLKLAEQNRDDEMICLGNLVGDEFPELFVYINKCKNYLDNAALLLKAGHRPDFEGVFLMLRTHEGQHLMAQHYQSVYVDRPNDKMLNDTIQHIFMHSERRPKLENIEWIREFADRIDKLEIFHSIISHADHVIHIEWFCGVVGWRPDAYLTDIATEILNGRYDANVGNENYDPYLPGDTYVDIGSVYDQFGHILEAYCACFMQKEENNSLEKIFIDRDNLIRVIKQVDNGKLFTTVQNVRWSDNNGNDHAGFF